MAQQAQYPEAVEILQHFSLSEEKMHEIIHRLTKEMNMGLKKETHPRATVKCFVTYVQDLPTGKERGKCLALDLGGTNFRVLLVTLKSETDVDTESKSYVISKALQEGPGKQLFDFIAECLSDFCKEHKIEKDNIPLGFTFSFPCKQNGIDNGTLVAWTKGFQADGVVGKNVVELLREAINRRGDLKVKVVAILNDTTGTLMSCAFRERNCRIGMIVGTGSNACYVENTSNCETFEGYQTSSKPNMIINCEWGAFGDNGVLDFVRTSYDKTIDLESVNPKKQIFEKSISGMYMGEAVRLIVVELMEKGVLFKGRTSQTLQQKWIFNTRYITEIESDSPGHHRNAAMVLDQLGIRTTNERDLACLRFICEAVSVRSAKLAACGLVALINKMNAKDLVVGIDGSVYRYHPHYHALLMENMNLLLKGSVKFQLMLSEDGSGRGAALIAAVSNK
ncbi:hexokinase type 2 [Drosophila grimshawi]|uniref:Phosphotransferase n=1 Tax=Drosophila grimshawi TaxID=7222 RepID=B4JG58_DROGR|nr:hexokinase type 2 [Drosophila grimshawi]EDV93625.1 GH19419 [Drosophila grimshawi]